MKLLFSILFLMLFSSLAFAQQVKEDGEPLLIAGKGQGVVAIGAKREVIEAVLGKGENRSKYDDVYFIDYPKKGVQISYTNKADEAYTIFFYNNQRRYENFVTCPIKSDKGITWKSSPSDIIKAYGKPTREFRDESGNNAWRRLEYDKTDFLFEFGELKRIGIHTELCTHCSK